LVYRRFRRIWVAKSPTPAIFTLQQPLAEFRHAEEFLLPAIELRSA